MTERAVGVAVLGSFMQACCWYLPRLPAAGETLLAAAFSTEAAGKGLGVAIGCHRLGARVDTIMAIGTDTAGDQLMRQLETEGLGTCCVHRFDTPSGHGAGLIDTGGENAIAVYPGANACLGAAEIAGAAPRIETADLVYGQLEIPVATVAAAFAIARRHRVTTVLNPSPWQDLSPQVLDITDVLIVNALEAGLLLGQPLPPDRAGRLASIARQLPFLRQRWDGDWLVVTLGAQGSAAFARDGDMVEATAHEVQAVSTVGAGDAFSAGFCVALAQGSPLADALRAGNAGGALAATRAGILAGLPYAGEVERLIRSAA